MPLRGFRSGEKILIAYFFYIALLAMVRSLPASLILLSVLVPAIIVAAIWGVNLRPRKWSSTLRDWLPLFLILVGYWELQWFASNNWIPWQQTWLRWDREVLGAWGLRGAIEALGPLIPAMLEATYLCVYVIPPLCLAALFFLGRRDRIDRLLTTMFLGGFCAYALLPLFPAKSPRLAFPGTDLPNFGSVFRTFNVWLLNNFDISTGVFPSGHVAVAFSSAFGLWRALPENRGLSYFMLAVATIVYIATIYSRYHYAMDGAASAAIAVFAWHSSEWVEQHV